MKIKKITALMLILSMLLLCFVILASCAKETGSDGDREQTSADNSDGSEGGADEAPVDPKTAADPKFEPVDMQGYEFKIGTRDSTHAVHGGVPVHERDLFAAEENGDLINDAVYKRNRAVEEKYNVKIVMDALPEDNEGRVNEVVAKSVKAGDKSYDLLMTHMHHGTTSAVAGYLYDIAKFPNIDISKPYWNKGANDGYSINHRLYVGLSDLSFSSNESLHCMFFNKTLAQNYGVEDIYALVRNNEWTFDKFNEVIKVGTADVDGNGKMDENDRYGYISTAAVEFLWAGGGHMMVKDEDDIPYLDFINQKTIDIYQKTYEMVNNEFTYSKEKEWYTGKTMEMFQNSQGVFFGNQLCRVSDLRATEFDFGIVPFPKYDSFQERYYSYVDGHASMMGIPLNLPNPGWTGMIIEEMSYLSYKDIMPVYYDVVLNVKMIRDEESVEMLKILFDSKVFDPAYVLGSSFWAMWNDAINSKKTEIVSIYEKTEKSEMSAMQKRIDAILALE